MAAAAATTYSEEEILLLLSIEIEGEHLKWSGKTLLYNERRDLTWPSRTSVALQRQWRACRHETLWSLLPNQHIVLLNVSVPAL